MEVNNPEDHRNNTDQVVLIIDQQNTKLKQSPHEDLNDPISQAPAKTRNLGRLNFSKPKSRFEEINYPPPPKTILESEELLPLNPNENGSSTDDDDDYEEWCGKEEEEEEEEEVDEVHGKYRRKKRIKIGKRALIEWSLFFIIMTCLICSLRLKSIKNEVRWGSKIRKWCLTVMVIFCGHLVSGWVVGFLVFLIDCNFMLREKILYFVYGLRKSFQNRIWLSLVLLAWVIMFPNVHKHNKLLEKVFRALITVLIGATIWLIKIILVKVLTSSFHVVTYFDRMKDTVFHHYVLGTLSGPPLDEAKKEPPRRRRFMTVSNSLPERWRDGLETLSKSKKVGSRGIDMEKLRKLSMESTASAWSVRRLVSYVMSSSLSTISRTGGDFGKAESEITTEWEARTCAQRIFNSVAKPGDKYIKEEDLLRFLKSEEVNTIFPLFEGAIEMGRITKSSFRNWVVHAYIERKSLAHSLNDTEMAVQQVHKMASAVMIVIIIIMSSFVMGLASTKILVVTSQLLLVGFMFQNTCKTTVESIIFVFVMHPFDVGDCCVIDGVQMIVEEMNILTTVFLRYDMEKIYYPNAVLLTKPISNFRRSPNMADNVDFTIDVSTSVDDVTTLKKAIQTYIESKPTHWNPKHSVTVKEIENMDKMKMSLSVQHTMNLQNGGETGIRRSELVFELKKIFENINIKYHLLPQVVHLSHVNMRNGS